MRPRVDAAAWADAVRVGMAVAYAAARRPHHLAVIAPSGDRTFAELNANANRLASALRDRGLGTGDAIAMLCSNRAEFVETWAACSRAGFRLTTVNWHLTPEEAAYIVADCGARAFVADAAHAGAVPPADAVRIRIAVGESLPGFERWEDVLAAGDPGDLADPALGTAMLYTSGTTGYPKGVRKPPDPDGLVAGVAIYGHVDDDVHLCTGPLYHAAPFTISMLVPITAGVPVVLMDKWDPVATLELIERHGVTHTHLVPTMFHRLLALPDTDRTRFDLSSLKGVLHGAAPCPVPVKQQMIDWWGPVLIEYYAATEGAGTVVDSATWLRKPGTVGVVDPAKVFVGDDEAQPLPAGDEGLVWLQAAGAARFEYFGDADKTAQSFRGDHFTLGDVGRIDDDGYLFLTDRSANLILSGGVNIYPAEIDAVLLGHPDVADAAAIGVPDDEWGEVVVAVVEAKPGATASSEELVQWCQARLSRFKCPRRVDFVPHLPRDDNGKIYKRRLRDDYRAAAAASER